MTNHKRFTAMLAALLVGSVSPIAAEENYEGPVTAKVLAVAPKVLDLKTKVIEIIGDTSGVEAKIAGMQLKESETEVKIELSGDVLFDFDKWDIRPVAEPALRQVSELIARHPGGKVSISGYTDSKGAEDYNLRLSRKRAESVSAWLVRSTKRGAEKFVTKGLGESNPVAPNANPDGSDNPAGRQLNRRVEIIVKKG